MKIEFWDEANDSLLNHSQGDWGVIPSVGVRVDVYRPSPSPVVIIGKVASRHFWYDLDGKIMKVRVSLTSAGR